MKIKIKRFHKDLPLPEHKTAGAAAFDLTARDTVTIPPKSIGYVPLNVAMEIPADHFLFLAPRSSTHKKGLMPANGIGIVDPDFCGDCDEIKSAYYNFTDQPVLIERGERISQGMLVKFVRAEWEEVDMMNHKTRGGFGSTGDK
jgi:dUTP pyrophosphatase